MAGGRKREIFESEEEFVRVKASCKSMV